LILSIFQPNQFLNTNTENGNTGFSSSEQLYYELRLPTSRRLSNNTLSF